MYETFFGLHRSPFNSIPNSDGVYASSTFQDAYLALHRGVERAESLILLTGESGTGKSTLLRQLQVALQAECFTVFAVNGTAGPEALVQTSRAVQELADRADDVVEATPGLAEIAPEGERRSVVVLLDDAHALPASVLPDLADLFSRKHTNAPRVSVIAAAQSHFEQQLTDPRAQAIGRMLEQRVTLRSMDAAEVGPYMTCKLEAAGHRGEALFTADAVRCIAQHSDGIPKRVDILSGMALLIASEAGRRTADVFIVREALDDLEGNAEAPGVGRPDSVQRTTRTGGPIADCLKAALEALARGSDAVAVFATDGARRLSGVCRRRLENLHSRGLRLLQTARGSLSSASVKAPGRAHMDRDRLGLKVGFVGLVCIALLGVLFVALGGRSTSSDPAAGEIASATKTNAALPALRNQQEIMALMQDKRRLESTLRETEENFRNSQTQVTEQQNQIEKLRQQAAASEARMAALRSSTPANIVLPDDVLLTVSTPAGDKFEVTPKDLEERSVRTIALLTAQFDPKGIEFLRSLSSNAETQSSPQGENAASLPVPDATPSDKSEIGLKEDAVAAIAQTKNNVAPGSVTEAAFEVSKKAASLQDAAASTVQDATIRETSKVVIPVSESIGTTPPSTAIVTAENPVAATGPSMPQESNLDLVHEESIIPREGSAAAIGVAPQDSPRADAAEELAARAPETAMEATVALAEDSAATQLPPVEDRSTTSNGSTAQLSVPGPGAGGESFDAQGQSSAADLPSTSTPPLDSSVQTPGDIVYEVVAGDTLSGIARRFGFTVAQLREWNGLNGDRLDIAQQLRMQAPPIETASVAPPAEPLKTPPVELNSLLLRAVQEGREAVVKALLDQGAPIEARDEEGNTPLILAASLGHWQVARLLAARGARVDARGETGHTALSFAAWNGQHGVLSTLLRRKADVDAKTNDGWTPLMYASINGHIQCVRSLLEQGADANARNRESRTALSAAVWNGHIEVARALLETGAKVNAKTRDGWTPLLAAAWNGEVELVRLLLDYGADPKLSSGTGLTPAAAAEQRGHGDLASTLSGISAKAKSS